MKCSDLTIVSLGLGVHRSLEAAAELDEQDISAEVLDLKCLTPLDRDAVCSSVEKTGRLLVVDEDYEGFGLSGEIAAVVLESDVTFKFARVCTKDTIPYARHLEEKVIPNKSSVLNAALSLMK